MARLCRAWIGVAARFDQSHHAEHHVGALPLGPAAYALPAHLRAGIRRPRWSRLVRPTLGYLHRTRVCGCDGRRSFGITRRARHQPGRSALLLRGVFRLPVLPRRTRATQTGAAVTAAVLP